MHNIYSGIVPVITWKAIVNIMSADTPRRSRSQGAGSAHVTPATASPQTVNDRSIIDSVAGFINEVVPTAYSTPTDSKDQIQWVHFEHVERYQSECFDSSDCENGTSPPLIVILGYGSGIQVWAVPLNGEAVEVLSWRHGAARVLRILPNPSLNTFTDKTDLFADKRPLMVLCDTSTPGPQYYSLSFISLKTGEQVKSIKFKNPVLEVLANKRSVVVTFSERIAIFDGFTLEDRLTVTTCYLSPGLNPNPVALGTRWLAYAEKKLIPARRSGGGNEGEGVQSYAATVLHAAKSLGKGLRELGETVASSLAGGSAGNVQHFAAPNISDLLQPGIVTILDIQSPSRNGWDRGLPVEAALAHFTAHSDAIVHLHFDPSGMLLLTADRRGHDFHLFRIQPHPGGPSLASVHHLYTLHRGDTTARVQHMCFSPDSRWASVSTLRGTTHVFPITPYGGAIGTRTHTTPHIVNRLSRFHRSAGLVNMHRTPSPNVITVPPLAQLRQSLTFPAVSDESSQLLLRVASCFAPPRASSHQQGCSQRQRRPVDSLFVVSSYGTLVQYDLEPKPAGKMCDETPVQLEVTARAQWTLQRTVGCELQAPLPADSLLWGVLGRGVGGNGGGSSGGGNLTADDHWLSQVEIVTHAGPHRRLWMGPQFTFKTYNGNSGSPVSVLDTEAIEASGSAGCLHLIRSKPLNMPDDGVPVLIESGSASSFEQSPRLSDREVHGTCGESQLREDLADAMLESPGRARDNSCRCVLVSSPLRHSAHIVAKVVNPLGTVVTVQSEPEDDGPEHEEPAAVIHENCDESLFRPVVAPLEHTVTYEDVVEDIVADATESDDSLKNKVPELATEPLPVTPQSAQKLAKKKSKKKRK